MCSFPWFFTHLVGQFPSVPVCPGPSGSGHPHASSSQEQSLSSLSPEQGFRFLLGRHAAVRSAFKMGFIISLSAPAPPRFILFPGKCPSEGLLCALLRADSRKAGHSLIPSPGDSGLGLGVGEHQTGPGA